MPLVVGKYTNLQVRGPSILRKRSRYPSQKLESLEPTNPATLQLHPVPLSTLPPSTPLPPWLQNVKSYTLWEVSFHPPGKVNHWNHHICQVTQVHQGLKKYEKNYSLSGACRGELMKSFGEPAGLLSTEELGQQGVEVKGNTIQGASRGQLNKRQRMKPEIWRQ